MPKLPVTQPEVSGSEPVRKLHAAGAGASGRSDISQQISDHGMDAAAMAQPAGGDKPKRITVTYSELDTFRQCALKHQLSYTEGWRKTPQPGSPLSRGSLFHNVMEVHYTWLQRDPNADLQEIQAFIRKHLLMNTQDPDVDQVLVDWIYEGYLECYGRDPNWEILEVEGAHRVPLGPPDSQFMLAFKLDLLVRQRNTGQIWLVDHKTARDFTRQTEIDIDDQFGLYSWGLRQLGIDVMGTIRSDSRTQRNKTKPMTMDQRFRRVPTFRTKIELAHLARDAYDCALSAYSADKVVYSSPAPDRCTWRCDYLQPHLLMRKGIELETSLPDYGYSRSDVKHQEYAENPLLDLIPVPPVKK